MTVGKTGSKPASSPKRTTDDASTGGSNKSTSSKSSRSSTSATDAAARARADETDRARSAEGVLAKSVERANPDLADRELARFSGNPTTSRAPGRPPSPATPTATPKRGLADPGGLEPTSAELASTEPPPEPATPAEAAEQATVAAAEAEQTLADTKGIGSPSVEGATREAAEAATGDAVRAQQEANEAAVAAGDPPPYPAADAIPSDVLEAGDRAIHEHVARQSAETQEALIGTESAITDEVRSADLAEVRAAADDPVAGAQKLEEVAERYRDNPEAVDALLEDLGPDLDRITGDVGSRDMGRDNTDAAVASLGRVAELATDEGASTIAKSILDGRGVDGSSSNPDLVYLDDAISHSKDGRGVTLGLALAEEAQARGATGAADDLRKDSINSLETLTADVGEARETREGVDAELQRDLSEFSYLSDEERADYVGAFQGEDDNRAAYEGEANSAARLDEVLARNTDALDQVAVDRPSDADQVVDAYAELAQTSLPGRALEWATDAKSPEVQAAFSDEAERIRDDVLNPAIEGSLLQFQAEAGGDPAAAIDRFEAAFDQLDQGKSLIEGVSDIAQIRGAAGETVDLLRGLGTARGRTSFLNSINEVHDGRGLSGFDGAMRVAGFGFALQNFGQADGFGDRLVAGAAASAAGVDLFARGLNSLNNAGRLGFLGDNASTVAKGASRYAGRFAIGVGIGLNALALNDSARDLLKDPGLGNALRVVGDSVAFVGSVVGAFPPAKPFAAIAEIAGLGLSALGSFISGNESRNRINDEQQARLEKVFDNRYPGLKSELGDEGFTEAIRQMADASDPPSAELAEVAGLNTRQMLELYGTVPRSNNRFVQPLMDRADVLGLSGDEFVRAAQGLNEKWNSPAAGPEVLDIAALAGVRGADDLIAFSNTVAADINAQNTDGYYALQGAYRELEAHAGTSFSLGDPAAFNEFAQNNPELVESVLQRHLGNVAPHYLDALGY